MLVRDLIKLLKSFPQDARVATANGKSKSFSLGAEDVKHWNYVIMINPDGTTDVTEYDAGVVLLGKF
jgi:hypothetical protein